MMCDAPLRYRKKMRDACSVPCPQLRLFFTSRPPGPNHQREMPAIPHYPSTPPAITIFPA